MCIRDRHRIELIFCRVFHESFQRRRLSHLLSIRFGARLRPDDLSALCDRHLGRRHHVRYRARLFSLGLDTGQEKPPQRRDRHIDVHGVLRRHDADACAPDLSLIHI